MIGEFFELSICVQNMTNIFKTIILTELLSHMFTSLFEERPNIQSKTLVILVVSLLYNCSVKRLLILP